MQNEPNLQNTQINISPVITKYYENKHLYRRRQNEPNLRKNKPNLRKNPIQPNYNKKMQNEPNLQNAQINVTPVKRKDYENKHPCRPRQNEPKTNPIYAQVAVDMLSWPAVRNFPAYSGQGLRNTVGPSSRLPAKTAYLYPAAPALSEVEGNKKMQNEPNLQNDQINVSAVKKKVKENKLTFARRQNEPNLCQNKPNPACPELVEGSHRSAGEAGSPVTNFTYKLQMHPPSRQTSFWIDSDKKLAYN